VLRLRSLLAEFRVDWDASGGPELPRAIVEAAMLSDSAAGEPEAVQVTDHLAPGGKTPREALLARLRRLLRLK
jgi:hypothetical protein